MDVDYAAHADWPTILTHQIMTTHLFYGLNQCIEVNFEQTHAPHTLSLGRNIIGFWMVLQ